MPNQGRIYSLDGLRGLAAGIVLLHHSLLVLPLLAAPYFDGESERGSVQWWLVNTPLHMLWDGTSAVYIFFILSGVVLARPVYSKAQSFDWRAFYPQRLARLYVPVWVAVGFAVATYLLVPRRPDMASDWLQAMPTAVTPERIALDATLVFGNGWLASPLWSLRWEIIFSLLLPAYMWAAHRLRGYAVIAMVGCLIVSAVGGAIDESALRYLPMFAIGVLLCPLLDSYGEQARKRPRLDGWLWPATLCAGVVLMSTRWIAPSLASTPFGSGLTLALAAAGAGLIVASAVCWRTLADFLRAAPLQWLGRISFSLYLVHEPIVITTAHLFGPGREYIAVPISIAVSVAAGWLFYRLVEAPSYALAKKFGHRTARPTPSLR